MCVSIFCSYGGIRLDVVLSVSLGSTGLNITVLLFIVISALANVNYLSKKPIESVRQRPASLRSAGKGAEGMWLQREIRSLKYMRISMGKCSSNQYVVHHNIKRR